MHARCTLTPSVRSLTLRPRLTTVAHSSKEAMASSADGQLRNVCVFCGASSGTDPSYMAAAKRMGEALVGQGLHLVYGGRPASVNALGSAAH